MKRTKTIAKAAPPAALCIPTEQVEAWRAYHTPNLEERLAAGHCCRGETLEDWIIDCVDAAISAANWAAIQSAIDAKGGMGAVLASARKASKATTTKKGKR